MYTSFYEKWVNFDIFYAIKTNPGVLILEIIKDNWYYFKIVLEYF